MFNIISNESKKAAECYVYCLKPIFSIIFLNFNKKIDERTFEAQYMMFEANIEHSLGDCWVVDSDKKNPRECSIYYVWNRRFKCKNDKRTSEAQYMCEIKISVILVNVK